MRMVQQFHDLNFAVDFLEVRLVQLCFVDDLNGDLSKRRVRVRMSAGRAQFFARQRGRSAIIELYK